MNSKNIMHDLMKCFSYISYQFFWLKWNALEGASGWNKIGTIEQRCWHFHIIFIKNKKTRNIKKMSNIFVVKMHAYSNW